MVDYSISNFTFRCPVRWILVVAAGLLVGSCTWVDKNVAGKVKNINLRALTVISDPPGAELFVNDVFQGKTPITIQYRLGVKDLWKGFVLVVEKKGYLPIRREVSYQRKTLQFRLIRKKR